MSGCGEAACKRRRMQQSSGKKKSRAKVRKASTPASEDEEANKDALLATDHWHLTGNGLHHAYAGQDATIMIHTMNADDERTQVTNIRKLLNVRIVQVTGTNNALSKFSSTAHVKMTTSSEDGLVCITYRPPNEGRIKIHISVQTDEEETMTPLPGSPFHVHVHSKKADVPEAAAGWVFKRGGLITTEWKRRYVVANGVEDGYIIEVYHESEKTNLMGCSLSKRGTLWNSET